MTNIPLLRILLAEDNADDVFFFKRLLRKTGFECPIEIAPDGDKFIEFLSAQIERAADSWLGPLVMFIDLKLPRTNGFEILQWLQHQPAVQHCLRIVLTSSDQECDVSKAFELGVHGYLVKYPAPHDLAAILTAAAQADMATDLSLLELPGIKRPLHPVFALPKL